MSCYLGDYYSLHELAKDMTVRTGIFITASDILNRMSWCEIEDELMRIYWHNEQLELGGL